MLHQESLLVYGVNSFAGAVAILVVMHLVARTL